MVPETFVFAALLYQVRGADTYRAGGNAKLPFFRGANIEQWLRRAKLTAGLFCWRFVGRGSLLIHAAVNNEIPIYVPCCR